MSPGQRSEEGGGQEGDKTKSAEDYRSDGSSILQDKRMLIFSVVVHHLQVVGLLVGDGNASSNIAIICVLSAVEVALFGVEG